MKTEVVNHKDNHNKSKSKVKFFKLLSFDDVKPRHNDEMPISAHNERDPAYFLTTCTGRSMTLRAGNARTESENTKAPKWTKFSPIFFQSARN
uniref:Uncharacterized protein n=1 Tax=Strigamia maritima TaxID=126957 RepID=T1J2S6_STRMM